MPILLENTIHAAKKNNPSYIQKNRNRYSQGDLDVTDHLGNTALFYAAQNMHLEALELLIQLGADVNRKCELGNTALHHAMMVGDKIAKNRPIIATLIQAGANPRLFN